MEQLEQFQGTERSRKIYYITRAPITFSVTLTAVNNPSLLLNWFLCQIVSFFFFFFLFFFLLGKKFVKTLNLLNTTCTFSVTKRRKGNYTRNYVNERSFSFFREIKGFLLEISWKEIFSSLQFTLCKRNLMKPEGGKYL